MTTARSRRRRAGEVRDEPAVSGGEHECLNAVLDAGRQPAHRRFVADPDIGDAVVVDIVAGLEEVDGRGGGRPSVESGRHGRPAGVLHDQPGNGPSRAARLPTPGHDRPAGSRTKSDARAGCRHASSRPSGPRAARHRRSRISQLTPSSPQALVIASGKSGTITRPKRVR